MPINYYLRNVGKINIFLSERGIGRIDREVVTTGEVISINRPYS